MDDRELWLLALATALGFVLVLAYTLAMRHAPLAGDAPEYDFEGQMIAQGHLFYTRLPFGILHAGAWKAPLYPAWVGFWYALFGHHPMVVKLIQVPVGVLTIPLTWLLARRLFGRRVAVAAALLVAVYPLAWQYDGLLYSEALATPLYVGLLILGLTREMTGRRAAGLGLLTGVALLLRPTTEFLYLGFLVAWSLRQGWRQGVGLTVVSVACAVLIVAPWTIRNEIVMHGFIPISMQDAAPYGTFNPQSAANRTWPWAWQDDPASYAYVFERRPRLSDVSLHDKLDSLALNYIWRHPLSVPQAFFWNGLTRLWDIRHPSHALAEVPHEGRSHFVTLVGLLMYYGLFVLALVALWRLRRRRWLLFGLLAMAFGASAVFTIDAGTRYRAPLEPLIAVLACAGVLGAGAPEGAAGIGTGGAATVSLPV